MDIRQLTTEKRNITLDSRRTSLQLELYIWANLEAILELVELPLPIVISAIDEKRNQAPLAQSVRLFCLTFFRIYLEKLNIDLTRLRQSTYHLGDRIIASEADSLDVMRCYYQALDDLEIASRT